jgi:ABC-type transport system involved in cytochrome c biogenesis ATPase subunit
VAVVGEQRSNLVYALAGELKKLDGEVEMPGSVAFVSSTGWVQRGLSIRENVLFYGKRDRPHHYNEVIEKCGLVNLKNDCVDEEMLTDGQKAQISLARAIYQEADVYLFEDPTLDQKIFQNTVGKEGMLRNKVRVLSTTDAHLIGQADLVVHVNGKNKVDSLLIQLPLGNTVSSGTYNQLLRNDPDFAQLTHQPEPLPITRRPRVTWQQSDHSLTGEDIPLIQAETFAANLKVYWDFLRHSMIVLAVVSFFALAILLTFLHIFQSVWLADWANERNGSTIFSNSTDFFSIHTRIGVYVGTGLLEGTPTLI